MTTTAGDFKPASTTLADSSESGASTTRCFAKVPFMTTAEGVVGARPPSMIFATSSSSFFIPMRITRVSTALPSSRQRVCSAGSVGSLWPVTTANDAAYRRSVTGMPAYASAPTIELTPGITSKGTSFSAQKQASSPPRPKTKGSPPLRRTTVCPALARSTIKALMSSWLRVGASCPRLPTLIFSARSGAR